MTDFFKKFLSTLKFLFKKDSVHLVTMSSSGTHWLASMISFGLSRSQIERVDMKAIMPHLVSENNARIRQSHSDYFWFAGRPKTVLLVRDLRDSLVSHYESYNKNRGGNISFGAFLRDTILSSKYGLARRVRFLNSWFKNKEKCSDFMLVKYEDLKADAEGQLKNIFKFAELDLSLIPQAVVGASLSSMKKLDDTKEKVNKGIVGRYKEYFTKEDEEYLRQYLQDNLLYDYGYEY
jgi:hypothetical protein